MGHRASAAPGEFVPDLAGAFIVGLAQADKKPAGAGHIAQLLALGRVGHTGRILDGRAEQHQAGQSAGEMKLRQKGGSVHVDQSGAPGQGCSAGRGSGNLDGQPGEAELVQGSPGAEGGSVKLQDSAG